MKTNISESCTAYCHVVATGCKHRCVQVVLAFEISKNAYNFYF